MPQLWFFYAIGAAVLWGASYAISEELLQRRGIPPSFLIFMEAFIAIPLYMVLVQTFGGFKAGIVATFSSYQTVLLVLVMGGCFMLGNFLIMLSVAEKNATLTSFIEISYPLFTILFVWMFFGKFDLNIYSGIGAFLVMSGVGLMFFKG